MPNSKRSPFYNARELQIGASCALPVNGISLLPLQFFKISGAEEMQFILQPAEEQILRDTHSQNAVFSRSWLGG